MRFQPARAAEQAPQPRAQRGGGSRGMTHHQFPNCTPVTIRWMKQGNERVHDCLVDRGADSCWFAADRNALVASDQASRKAEQARFKDDKDMSVAPASTVNNASQA
jgi:hypothetical protein